MSQKKSVCVLGLGYIGLPTAALLASGGYRVNGVDIRRDVVDSIKSGISTIVEPNLEALIKETVKMGSLTATDIPVASDIYIVCVPTPLSKLSDEPRPDIGFVLNAIKSIAALLKPGDLVIVESTCPVGTISKIKDNLMGLGVKTADIDIACCPERVLPGNILYELIENERVVGGLTPKATAAAVKFYKTFVKGTVHGTNAKTAEMCKLTENSFRDVNIAFANEVSLICEKEGINVSELIGLANRHPRVDILNPGIGVGGHCLAVDPWFLVASNPENSQIIKMSRQVNDNKTQWVLKQILNEISLIGKKIEKPTVACFGLTFKADVDDVRHSPALKIVESLKQEGVSVISVDPNIGALEGIDIVEIDEAFEKADLFVLLVRHQSFLNGVFLEKINKHRYLDFCGVGVE